MRVVSHAAVFVILTILTQIGGLVWIAAMMFAHAAGLKGRLAKLIAFALLYAGATIATAYAAPHFGRIPLSCFAGAPASLAVRSPLFCALNRNYVSPQMHKAAEAFATHMATAYPGTKTIVLDANFPFIDGFPLLPHLSHADGRKLDIAFYYVRGGTYLPGETRSPIGYFAFEQSRTGDFLPCAGRNDWLTLRWDFDLLQPLFPDYGIDEARMADALRWLTSEGVRFGVEKIFVEPHIASSLGVSHDRIRFQGCRAARHDDHIHFQVK